MNTNWKTKEEYLAFVRDWKAAYNEISALIREGRFCSRGRASLAAGGTRFAPHTLEVLEARQVAARARGSVVRDAVAKDSHCYSLSDVATWLIEVRAAEKARAAQARAADIAVLSA